MKNDIVKMLRLAVMILAASLLMIFVSEYVMSSGIDAQYTNILFLAMVLVYSIFLLDTIFLTVMLIQYFDCKFKEQVKGLQDLLTERRRRNELLDSIHLLTDESH